MYIVHSVVTDIDRQDQAMVSAFENIPSAIVSDVTGNIGQTMDSGIKPIHEDATFAGSAITIKGVPGDNLIIHKAIKMAREGDVLVIDGDGYTETAYLGELMCASCQAHGLAGIVIDGAVRDREAVEAMAFPLFARGVHPQGPLKQSPGSINVPVSCAGVTVEPGDIVVGDNDGVAVVAGEEAENILKAAQEKLDAEDELRDRVEDGEYLFDIGGYDELLNNLSVVGPEDAADSARQ